MTIHLEMGAPVELPTANVSQLEIPHALRPL